MSVLFLLSLGMVVAVLLPAPGQCTTRIAFLSLAHTFVNSPSFIFSCIAWSVGPAVEDLLGFSLAKLPEGTYYLSFEGQQWAPV